LTLRIHFHPLSQHGMGIVVSNSRRVATIATARRRIYFGCKRCENFCLADEDRGRHRSPCSFDWYSIEVRIELILYLVYFLYMKKAKPFIFVALIGLIIFAGFKVYNRNGDSGSSLVKGKSFPISTLPDIQVKVGEEFTLEQGQQAVFTDINASVRYAGVSGQNGGDFPMPPMPRYDFLYKGLPFSFRNAEAPYNIQARFGSDGDRTAIVVVSNAISDCESKDNTKESSSCFSSLAERYGGDAFCEYIKVDNDKQECFDSYGTKKAREVFFDLQIEGSKLVADSAPVVESTRDACKNTTYSSGMCKIVGKTTVMTPQQCSDLLIAAENSEEGVWGVTFYEDCFSVAMYVYGPQPNVCFPIERAPLETSCLVASERARTLNVSIFMDSLPKQ